VQTGSRSAAPPLRAISPEDVEELSSAMNGDGVGVLRNVISDFMLERAGSYVKQQLEKHNGQYFAERGPEWTAESSLDAVFRSEGFHAVLKGLYEKAMGASPPSDRITPSIRVLSGRLGLRHSNLFHYDSYVVTALVPILIPTRPDEPPGHLVMFPNLRNVRRRAVVNIIEKALVESSAGRRLWRSPWVQRVLGARVVPLEPGNIYYFWGMRSLHANQPCLPESVRSTALFHFGDPHEKSIFKQFSQRRAEAASRRLAARTR
jgi:hypothetical protein